MTVEPNEDAWRALAETAAGDGEPSEFTDRWILKEAARIASERRSAAAQPKPLQRWRTGALAASLALVAIGVGAALVSGRFGGGAAGPGDDTFVPAGAEQTSGAPDTQRAEAPLQFAPDGITLLPSDQDELAAAVSQIDPCAAGVRLELAQAALDAKRAALRATAVAAALRQVSGSRCAIVVEPVKAQDDHVGTGAVFIISHR